MPFDIDVKYTIPARGSWDVSNKTPRERLEMLRDFLRTDVPNVAWDFTCINVEPECGTAGCALGWYEYLVGTEKFRTMRFVQNAAVEFGISDNEARWFFVYGPMPPNADGSAVTPNDVANTIDRYLAS